LQGFPLQLTGPHFKAPGTRSPPVPRDRGVDMQAQGLVGTHGMFCVELVRMLQQDACPQDHILALGPNILLGSLFSNTGKHPRLRQSMLHP
jgi:hypothetical protein